MVPPTKVVLDVLLRGFGVQVISQAETEKLLVVTKRGLESLTLYKLADLPVKYSVAPISPIEEASDMLWADGSNIKLRPFAWLTDDRQLVIRLHEDSFAEIFSAKRAVSELSDRQLNLLAAYLLGNQCEVAELLKEYHEELTKENARKGGRNSDMTT